MKKKLTSEEILKLPEEEFKEYMEAIKKEKYDRLVDLGDANYPNYSFDLKVAFWCERLNKIMRDQAEAGLDEYASFNKVWYNTMKRIEPEIDSIIESVFKKFKNYHWDWSFEEFHQRIKQ